ncbi:RICIN domain-containing protein [Streptomyces sp. J2-1]|uniref:RICIN domain-containing protein n=1 Tax=Streptomyces corallincola TaxID=2851888 RepID=UPI001C387EA6|nr:RICIN domain-containing protein [Streptomyces corallincola]MBV2356906.1 RICIN domain-containing protein [Streptomyces corallincola]
MPKTPEGPSGPGHHGTPDRATPPATRPDGAPDTGAYGVPDGAPDYASTFSRQHFFAGARFLKPGRRAAVAVASVAAVALIGTGATAAVAHFGGDTVDAQRVATGRPLAASASPSASATATPSGAPSGSPSSKGHTKKPEEHGRKSGHRAESPADHADPPAWAPAAPPPAAPPARIPEAPKAPTKHVAAPPAQKPIVFSGSFLQNYDSNRCLASRGRSRTPGTTMILADCNSSDASQGWSFRSDGTVRNFAGTRCLDTSGSGNGATLVLGTCAPSRSSQGFVLKPSYDLVQRRPDLCVDAKDHGKSAGTALQLWTCVGTSNQKWHMP